jgi:tetratricopeptide (TPR) repeat protein
MKKIAIAVAALCLVSIVLVQVKVRAAGAEFANAPRYNAKGELIAPTNYRDWVFLTSGYGMNYAAGASSHQMFTNVFVNPEAHREFLRTGHWPDKTTWVVELYMPASHGSINKQGHYQDAPMGLDVEVKDSSKPNGWQYYFVGLDDKAVSEVRMAPACFGCHTKNGAVEKTFVQFYPTLLSVAVKKGTLNPGYQAPLNATRFYEMLTTEPWPKAEAAYQANKKVDPDGESLGQMNMAAIGDRLLSNGYKQQAATFAELLTREFPGSTESWALLANAYSQTGRKQQAVASYEKALTVIAADSMLSADDRKQATDDINQRIAALKK